MPDSVFTGLPSGVAANWSPTIVSREVFRIREAKLVVAPRVHRAERNVLQMGQQVNVRYASEGVAQDAGADRTYQPQSRALNVTAVAIDQFKVYPFSVGVDADLQTIEDVRATEIPAAGYVLAKEVDDFLWSTADNAAVTQTDTEAGPVTDVMLRRQVQYLEGADAVDKGDGYIAMGPQSKNEITAITRFSSLDFTSKRSAETGKLGDIYGLTPLLTTRAGTDSNGYRRIFAWQKEGLILVLQKNVQVATMKYPLRTDYVAFEIYGAARSNRLNHMAWLRMSS